MLGNLQNGMWCVIMKGEKVDCTTRGKKLKSLGESQSDMKIVDGCMVGSRERKKTEVM